MKKTHANYIIKNLGERQVQHDLACFILDLDGMVLWILAPSCEGTFETLGSAQCFAASRLHTGEVEAKIVTAPTVAVAANVKEKARHGVFQR